MWRREACCYVVGEEWLNCGYDARIGDECTGAINWGKENELEGWTKYAKPQ